MEKAIEKGHCKRSTYLSKSPPFWKTSVSLNQGFWWIKYVALKWNKVLNFSKCWAISKFSRFLSKFENNTYTSFVILPKITVCSVCSFFLMFLVLFPGIYAAWLSWCLVCLHNLNCLGNTFLPNWDYYEKVLLLCPWIPCYAVDEARFL